MAALLQFVTLCIIAFNCIQTAPITITTQLGEIKGTSSTAFERTIYTFNGISYATSPIGDRRFRQATLNTSKWNGIYDATKAGPECIQLGTATMNEDCLFLNIYTTKSNVDNSKTKLVPVMFFIHGGGFTAGSGSIYNAANFIAQYGDMVYVSINYRLGPLGFLNNEAIYEQDPNFKSYGGANGLFDQITALKWVKNFISDYGGDPNQITIFGESAGGLSVCALLVSPLAANLYQRAIIESGSCIGPWGPFNVTVGIQYGNNALINNSYPINNLTYLRSIPAKQFVTKMLASNNNSWVISVDGLILNDLPMNIYANISTKLNAKEAVVAGFNSMDGIVSEPFYANPFPKTDSEYKAYINRYIHNTTQQNEIYSIYYPPSDFPPYFVPGAANFNSYELAWWTMNGDVCVICPTLKLAQQISTNELSSKMYVYEFLGPGADNGEFYAPHASELAYVFDWGALAENFYHIPWNQNLSDSMVSSWSNMGKYGVPNITNKFEKINLNWNVFDTTGGNVILFNDNIENMKNFKSNYRKNVCDFWYEQVKIETMEYVCWDIDITF
eukprot:490791_1